MADTHETIADIIAEMRRRIAVKMSDAWYTQEEWRKLCDRLEAAWKRERAKIEADALAVGGIVGASHRRELSKNASKNGADFGRLGDAAKLREACDNIAEYARSAMCHTTDTHVLGYLNQIEGWAKAALAAPARNCDAYNNQSCRMAYHLHGDGLMTMQAFADWLYAPATEKGGGSDEQT